MKTLECMKMQSRGFSLKLFFTIILIFVIGSSIFGQSNGKISGLIVDADIGESLIGVNVMNNGTMLGAATDLDGKFIITSVPPGEY